MADAVSDARARFEEAVDALKRAGRDALDAAAARRVDAVALAEARTRVTFALAAVGMTFKAALRAALPDVPE